MRHGKKHNHLGRTDSHRKAMLGNMASSLILHKRIQTTLAKAKALRVYVEPLVTKSKSDTTHSRRTVFSYLQNKDAVTILFREIAEKVANRPGGYTRIIKLENRLGDNAEMAIIELVDYNTVYGKDTAAAAAATTTRRSRRGGKGGVKATETGATPVAIDSTTEETNADTDAATAEVTPADDAVTAEPEATSPSADEAPVQNKDNADKGE